MNPFVAYMQYLASVEEDAATGHANSSASITPCMSPDEVQELDDNAGPLLSSEHALSFQFRTIFFDLSTPASDSVLFQHTTSSVASLSPNSEH